MRLIAMILALVCAAVAVMYIVIPADSLPTFFPGYAPGSNVIHTKHGIAAAVAAVILFAFSRFAGRR